MVELNWHVLYLEHATQANGYLTKLYRSLILKVRGCLRFYNY